MRKILTAPAQIQLRLKEANSVEAFIGMLVGRYYEPFSEATRDAILAAAAIKLERDTSEITNAEDVFQVAYQKSTTNEVTRSRLDSFLNQYGFCRNLALVSMLGTGMMIYFTFKTETNFDLYLTAAAAVISVGMLVRFIKFYASFSAEVLRSLLG